VFTGIVQGLAVVRSHEYFGGDLRLTLDARSLAPDAVNIGDSIAVDGVCLTVVANHDYLLRFDISNETLAVTQLADLRVGDRVNVDLALTFADRLGGHLVSGHVDGIARLIGKFQAGGSERMVFSAPAELHRFIAAKGSICLDGVSLTVNRVDSSGFEVNIVPHTLQMTTLGARQVGDPVHLEVDMIARYLDRLLGFARNQQTEDLDGITKNFLAEQGFLAPDVDEENESMDQEQ